MAQSKKSYPIFLECLEYTLDPYWRQVFEDCAKGKFPKGSGIDAGGNAVYFKSKDTPKWHQLETNPEAVYQQLKTLFQTNLNLKSKKDRSNIREEIEILKDHLESLYSGSWSSIRKKSIKDALIRNFVLEMKTNYNLNQEQTVRLHRLLQLGFLFNWIDNDNVVYENKEIMEIKNLFYDNETEQFELNFGTGNSDPTQTTPRTQTKKKIKRDFVPIASKMSGLWKKNWESTRNKYKEGTND